MSCKTKVTSLLIVKLWEYDLKDEVLFEYRNFSSSFLVADLDIAARLIVAKICYERKMFSSFVELYKTFDDKILEEDYYINELAGESYSALNDLTNARVCFSRALKINDQLVAAFHKKIVLDYKLDGFFSKERFFWIH